MKPNWSLIVGGVFFAVAVFAAAVLDGFNAVEPAPAYATANAAG